MTVQVLGKRYNIFIYLYNLIILSFFLCVSLILNIMLLKDSLIQSKQSISRHNITSPVPDIIKKISVLNFDLLVTIQRGPIPVCASKCHGNGRSAWSLFNKCGWTAVSFRYWPLAERLNAGDISGVEFAISTNMRLSVRPAWQHIKSIQITWIPNTLIPVSGGMHYN